MSKLTLVLLPGLDGTGDLFAPFMRALGDRYRVLVVGYPLDESLGYRALEAIVRAQLPADESFVLLGESFSGPIAITIAAAPPPNLKATILCCTFARNPRPHLAALRGMLLAAFPAQTPTWVASALLLGDQATPALRTALRNVLDKLSPQVVRKRLQEVLAVDVTTEAASIRMPVLYLRARHDRLVPDLVATELRRTNSLVQVERIDAPHFLLQACPDAAVKAIEAFLDTPRCGR